MTLRLDLNDQDFFRDPAARIAELRDLGPVIRIKFPIVGKVWITTTYEMAGRVLKDSGTFTLRKEGGGVAGLRWWMPRTVRALANNMLTMDEPDHTRLRSIVDDSIMASAVAIGRLSRPASNRMPAQGWPTRMLLPMISARVRRSAGVSSANCGSRTSCGVQRGSRSPTRMRLHVKAIAQSTFCRYDIISGSI